MTKQEELFLKVWNDPFLFCKNFIKIVNKSGELVPFEFNKPQKNFIDKLDRFNIILKSRQIGFSVCTCGIALHKAITQPYSNILMLSHNDESTRAIFNKLKNMLYTIPEPIRPELLRNNRAELQFANGSIISCTTMSKRDKGRGNTLALIHISEFAFVGEQAERQLLSLEQALTPNGNLIIESTANGVNFFSDLYYKAKNRENAYQAYFYNYNDGSCMFLEEYKKCREIFRNINGHYFNKNDLTEEEMLLYKNHNVSLDTLCWRRLKISNSSIDHFNQEYPFSDDLAFFVTGSSVFDKQCIVNQRERIKQVKTLMPVLHNVLQPYLRNKQLQIYELPKQGDRYICSCDCSEGIGKDYHVVTVWNYESKKQVAMFRNNKLRCDLLAEIINYLGRYYNNSYIIVELASGGFSVTEKLFYTYHYMNFHRHKTFDMRGKEIKKLGYDTNAKTKGLCINALREMFEAGVIQINSEVILDEMLVFTFDNGKYGAKNGFHDDTVMSCAIACEVMKTQVKFKVM